LKDSLLLAEVYLQLKGGRERRLSFLDPADQDPQETAGEPRILETRPTVMKRQRPTPLPLRSSQAERDAHTAFVLSLGGKEYPPAWRDVLVSE
jgi:DNA polymerase III subunit epsilon